MLDVPQRTVSDILSSFNENGKTSKIGKDFKPLIAGKAKEKQILAGVNKLPQKSAEAISSKSIDTPKELAKNARD